MTVTEFVFDPDDLSPKPFVVPGGVSELLVYAVGGGSFIAPGIGLRIRGCPVTPGETLAIDLGGPPSEFGTDGGYGGGGRTGGAGGGGYDEPNGARGYGGGGATEIRDGDGGVLVVAGGAGGRASGSSIGEQFVSTGTLPAAGVAPRVPIGEPSGFGVIAYDIWIPGVAGGELVGADGVYQESAVENGTYWGSGAGGGGYGGGGSGGIGFYHYLGEDVPEGTYGGTFPGRPGGSLVPGGASWAPWLGLAAGDGIYSWLEGSLGGGFVRIDTEVPESDAGLRLGRRRL